MNSQINIQVELDAERMPESISWNAPDGGVAEQTAAKAIMLSIWDGAEKAALHIDLWTKKMMVDEMTDFIYQTIHGMADTFERATHNNSLAQEMKAFAKAFHQKAYKAMEEHQS